MPTCCASIQTGEVTWPRTTAKTTGNDRPWAWAPTLSVASCATDTAQLCNFTRTPLHLNLVRMALSAPTASREFRSRNRWTVATADHGSRVSKITDAVIKGSCPLASEEGDTIIDGGNSYYRDDIRHAKALGRKGHLQFHRQERPAESQGLERGYRLMIGGEDAQVDNPNPGSGRQSHQARATSAISAPATHQKSRGWLHCGPNGAGRS